MLTSYVTISVMLIARFFSSGWLLATLKVLGTVIGVTVGFLISLTLFTPSDLIPVKQLLLDWASSETAGAAAKRYPHEGIGEFMLIWTTEPTIWDRLKWVLWGGWWLSCLCGSCNPRCTIDLSAELGKYPSIESQTETRTEQR